jgi:hypothetical protein
MAPERGESPPPETQTDKQLNAPPSIGGEKHTDHDLKKQNQEFLQTLESNPEHILHKHAENKTSKEFGNITLKSDGDIVK